MCYTLHMKKEEIEEILRLRSVHQGMVRRCYHPSDSFYEDYGGRGIRVSDRWLHDPAEFVMWALGNQSEPGLHLDRIDNAGNYEPDNCRFVTPTVNNRNRRNTVWATAFGETKPLGAWMEDSRCAVAYPTLIARIKAGWDHERALTKPSQRTTTRSIDE